MRKQMWALAGLMLVASGAAWAASDVTSVGWAGNGDPLPAAPSGAVQPDDDTYLAPIGCSVAGTMPQNYDVFAFTNAGNTSESVTYTVGDTGGNCQFPTAGGAASNPVRLVVYRGNNLGTGFGSFDPANPSTNCFQVVSAGSGICPTVTVSLPAFEVATFVISTAVINPPVPRPSNAPTGTGNGLFGYVGDLGGTTPVSLQSFTVDQGR